MGVTHKFHNDLIDFVIEQKRTNERLSCRQIADLVREKRGVHVSKSSVNNLLKAARLSSSVGRRLIKSENTVFTRSADTFQIPEERKKNISDQILKASSAAIEPAAHIKEPAQPEAVKIFPPANIPSPIPEIRQSLKQPLLSEERWTVSSEKFPSTELLNQGMGLVFLKAAQWSMTSKNVTAPLLKGLFSASDHRDFAAWCEATMLMRFLNAKEDMDLNDVRQRGFCILNDYDPARATADFSLISAAGRTLLTSTWKKYELEEKFLNMDVHAIRLKSPSCEQLWMDPQMVSVWEKRELCRRWPCAVTHALNALSRRWTANREPVVLAQAPHQMSLLSALYEICEKPGSAHSAEVWNEDIGVVAEFSNLPDIRRNFVVGIRPWQKEYKPWLETEGETLDIPHEKFTVSFRRRHAQAMNQGYSPLLKKTFYSREYECRSSDGQTARSLIWNVYFKQEKGAPFLGLLTNQKHKPSAEILDSYFERWPCESRGGSKDDLEMAQTRKDPGRFENASPPQSSGDLIADIQDRWVARLMDYACRIFLTNNSAVVPKQDVMTNFLKIPGQMILSENRRTVFLKPPEDYSFAAELQEAVFAINNMNIRDWDERNLFIEIS